jgi:hypothetical protein
MRHTGTIGPRTTTPVSHLVGVGDAGLPHALAIVAVTSGRNSAGMDVP